MKTAQIIGAVVVLANTVLGIYLENRSRNADQARIEEIKEIRQDYETMQAYYDSLVVMSDNNLEIIRLGREVDSVERVRLQQSFDTKLLRYEIQFQNFRARLDDIGELPDF